MPTDWDAFVGKQMGNIGAASVANANTVPDDADPDTAAKALNIARQTGMNPAIVYGNYDELSAQQQLHAQNSLIANNPHLQNYIDNVPLGKEASQGDWGAMDKISQAHDEFTKNRWLPPEVDALPGAAKTGLETLGAGAWQGVNETQQWIDSLPVPNAAKYAIASFLPIYGPKAMMGMLGSIPEAVYESTKNLMENSGHDWGQSIRTAKELASIPEYFMTRGDLGTVAGETGAMSPAMHAALPWMIHGEMPPPGVHEDIDKFHATNATEDKKKLDELVRAVNSSSTKAVDVANDSDFVHQFLKLKKDGQIAISPDGIKMVYGDDKEPELNDGKLGWVPNIVEQVKAARENGSDVEVPLAKYATHIDPKLHTELSDHLRLRDRGTTIAEAEARKEEEEEPKEEEEETVGELEARGDYHLEDVTERYIPKTDEEHDKIIEAERALERTFDIPHQIDQSEFDYIDEERKQLDTELASGRIDKRRYQYETQRLDGTEETLRVGQADRRTYEKQELAKAPTEEARSALRDKWADERTRMSGRRPRYAEQEEMERYSRAGQPIIDYGREDLAGPRIWDPEERIWREPRTEEELRRSGEEPPPEAIDELMRMREEKESTERVIDIKDAKGKSIGTMYAHEIDGGRGIYVSDIQTSSAGALRAGAVRGLAAELKRIFPNAKEITGSRVTGARRKADAVGQTTVRLPDEIDHTMDSVREASGNRIQVTPAQRAPNLMPDRNALRPSKVIGHKTGYEGTTIGSIRLVDILDRLRFDFMTDANQTMTRFLVNRFKEVLKDVPIHIVTQEEMDKLNNRGDPEMLKRYGPVPGYYSSRSHAIIVTQDMLNGSRSAWLQTDLILHEAGHAFTYKVFQRSPSLRGIVQKMIGQINTHLGQLKTLGTKNFTVKEGPRDIAEYDLDTVIDRFQYPLQSPDELFSGAYGDSQLRQWLAEIPMPPELINEIRQTTKFVTDKGRIKTMWDGMRAMIGEIWSKATGRNITGSALDGILQLGDIVEHANLLMRDAREDPAIIDALANGRALDAILQRKATRLTPKQFRQYIKKLSAEIERDKEFKRKRLTKEYEKRFSTEWKANAKQIGVEARQTILARPDIAAYQYLSKGQFLGNKIGNKNKILASSVPAELRNGIPPEFFGDTGFSPADWAGFFGHPSGDAFLQSLKNVHQIATESGESVAKRVVRESIALAQKLLEERHGKLEQNILEAVEDHLLHDNNLDILHFEVLDAAARAGETFPIDRDGLQKGLRDRFNTTAVSSHTVKKHMDAAGRAGDRAHNALLDERFTDAFKAKQEQYAQMYYAKLAKETESHMKQLERITKRYKQRTVQGVAQRYTNWVHSILNQIGYQVRNPIDLQREIDRETAPTLNDFVRHENNPEWMQKDPLLFTDFDLMPVADFLMDPNYKTKPEDMNPAELKAVLDSVKTLIHHGRSDIAVERAGVKADMKETIEEMDDQIESIYRGLMNTEARRIELERREGRRYTFRTGLVSLLPIEDLMRRLDRGNPDGVFQRMITRPIFEGMNEWEALKHEYSQKIAKTIKFPKDLQAPVQNPGFIYDSKYNGQLRTLTKENVLAMVHNFGNSSNRAKLMHGLGIKGEDAEKEFFKWLVSVTTKDDWDRAQQIGDLKNELFERAADMYHMETGVAPERVELSPFQVNFADGSVGSYTGWYHKIRYDAERFDPDKPQTTETKTNGDLFDRSYFKTATPSGYTKKRTGYVAPLQLDFQGITYSFDEILRDIALRPAVTQVAKIFADKRFKAMISRNAGPEVTALLNPWLKDVAGQSRLNDAAGALGNGLLSKLRQNIISVLIGYNPVTVAKHAPTAAFLSMKEVGVLPFLHEFATMWTNADRITADKNWNFALKKSEELQRRLRHFGSSLAGAERSIFQESSTREWMQEMGTKPIAFSDLASAVPTWLTVFKREMRNGATEGDAVSRADYAVRRAHGTTAIAGRARIMRGGTLSQFAVPFYTFFNRMFAGVYEMGWRASDALGYARTGDYAAAKSNLGEFTKGFFAYIAFPALVEQLLSPIGNPKDTTAERTMKVILRSIAMPIPVVRDMAEGMLGGHDPSIGLYSTAGQEASSIYSDARQMAMGKAQAGKIIRDATTILGTGLGYTNAEEGKLLGYAWNVTHHQDQSPRGLADAWRAVTKGYVNKPRRAR